MTRPDLDHYERSIDSFRERYANSPIGPMFATTLEMLTGRSPTPASLRTRS
jgi:hypothetical protein